MLESVKRLYWDAHNQRVKRNQEERLAELRERFASFTMLGRTRFIDNLRLVHRYQHVPGAIVECGTWKGGMIAAIASLLGPSRQYFLFDSYEGLPPPSEADGVEGQQWVNGKDRADYFNNCSASREDAELAMKLSGVPEY